MTQRSRLVTGRQSRGNHASRKTTKKRILKNEDSLRDLWGNIETANILTTGVSEGEEREKGTKELN